MRVFLSLPIAFSIFATSLYSNGFSGWKKHILHESRGGMRTASVGDYTKDGIPDIITSSEGQTILFVGPKFKPLVIHEHSDHVFIHSAEFDVDGDGDLDFVGGRHRTPGIIVWFEQPENPLEDKWIARNVSSELIGIHSLITADIDRDGKLDLLATSALKTSTHPDQPSTDYPESLVWFSVPEDPHNAEKWEPHAFADKDAPGATHYIGVGDVNNDGRIDAAVGAKIGAFPNGNYFAWWEAPADPTRAWTKHLINQEHPGASHIYPADLNGDGQMDFAASRGHADGVFWFKGPDWELEPIHMDIRLPHALVIFDMEGDGDTDIATCAKGSLEVWWYENDGRGNFTNHFVATGQAAYDIRAADMDQDGDKDFVIGGDISRNLMWCENPAN